MALVVVTNLCVKKFRSLLAKIKKKKLTPDFAVFRVSNVIICTADTPVLSDLKTPKLRRFKRSSISF